jgi:hypothetical protein
MVLREKFWLLLLIVVIIASGCSHLRVHSIYVADFDTLSPQPEADILAQKIPDMIAEKLKDKDVAEVVSRQEIEDADLTVNGRIVNYVPSQGWQRFQSAHAFLTVVIEAHGKNARGEPVGYAKEFNFNNALPEKGFLMAFIRSFGVLAAKVLTAPFGGFSAQENKFATKAANDIRRIIKGR